MAGHVEVDEIVLKKIAQTLATNEKKIRDQAVKKLRKWLRTRSQGVLGAFTEDDMLKIWKGLHYCMWMSDKPVVQEELADTISDLLQCFETDFNSAVIFIDTFFKTETREWFGIDMLRLDKFMMLIRKFLGKSFTLLETRKWKKKEMKKLAEILSGHVISANRDDVPQGIKMHIADIYLTELENSCSVKLTGKKLQELLEPYCVLLSKDRNKNITDHVIKRIFLPLKSYPTQTTEQQESDDESAELKVDHKLLADRLFELGSSSTCVAKNRKKIYNLVKEYRNLSEGTLSEESDQYSEEEPLNENEIEKAVARLGKFESTLMARTMKTKKKRKKGEESSAEEDLSDTNGDLDEPPTKKQKTISKLKEQNKNEPTVQKKKKKKQKKKQSQSSPNKNITGKSDKAVDNKPVIQQKAKGGVEAKSETSIKKKQKNVQEDGKTSNKKAKKLKVSKVDENKNNCELMEADSDKVPKLSKKSSHDTEANHNTSTIEEKANIKGDKNKQKTEELGVLKADIVVPSRRGKLKDLVHQGLEMQKPNIKVITDGPEDNSSGGGTVRLLSAGDKDSVVSVFTGGFVDDSDDEKAVTKKTKAMKKRKSLPADLTSYTEIREKSDRSTPKNDKVTKWKETGQSAKLSKSEKRRKRNSTGNIADTLTQVQKNTKLVTPPNNKRNGQDKKRTKVSDVEIEVTSSKKKLLKKAQQLKGEETVINLQTSPRLSNGIISHSVNNESPFASFDKHQKAPPAFVKKVFSKVTPQSGSKSNKQKSASAKNSDSNNRRVSFVLHKNTAQEFKESLQPSPVLAFDPKVTPNQGILKASPASLTKSPSSGFSPMPKLNLEKAIFKKKRPRAEDFF